MALPDWTDYLDRLCQAEFGIHCLGAFVGSLLGFGLAKSGGGLKAALTVVGVALGSGPLLFLKEAGEARWSYPIGLVIGLLMVRLYFLRKELQDRRLSKVKRRFAWLDLVIITVVTVVTTVWVALPETPGNVTGEQRAPVSEDSAPPHPDQ